MHQLWNGIAQNYRDWLRWYLAEKVDKEANLHENWNMQTLFYRVFWIFLPNVIKIDPYNFELYRFKVGAFLRHSVYVGDGTVVVSRSCEWKTTSLCRSFWSATRWTWKARDKCQSTLHRIVLVSGTSPTLRRRPRHETTSTRSAATHRNNLVFISLSFCFFLIFYCCFILNNYCLWFIVGGQQWWFLLSGSLPLFVLIGLSIVLCVIFLYFLFFTFFR